MVKHHGVWHVYTSIEEPRKPLVLRGARQTGETAAVRELGSRFELFIELNLERFEDLTLVRSCGSADELLAALAARLNLARFPEQTLLFFDEIQESAQAIRWLRFLREDHPDLFVIAAGSFLEVRLEERGFAFPVGRVTFRTLRPCTFSEFLGATGHDVLAGHLLHAAEERGAVARPFHEQALELLREYLSGRTHASRLDRGPYPNGFFATKKPGHNSGLGLSIVYSIIKDFASIPRIDTSLPEAVSSPECSCSVHPSPRRLFSMTLTRRVLVADPTRKFHGPIRRIYAPAEYTTRSQVRRSLAASSGAGRAHP